MGLNENLERLTAAYQELLKRELEPFLGDKDKSEPLNDVNFKKYMLKDKDINEVCNKYSIKDCDELKSHLINYSQYGGYHTPHFDLIYRIVNIRNWETQPPLPLEYRIEVEEELVPDFGRWGLSKDVLNNDILKNLGITREDLDLLEKALDKNARVSTFQKGVIREILKASTSPRDQAIGIGIIAPTSSGKTLSFLIPALIKALERVKKRERGVSALLVYPRKALERDQLKRILEIIDRLNEMLNRNNKGNRDKIYITIGIDDGDTLRKNKVEDGESFRNLKCIKSGCDGDLVYLVDKSDKVIVKCTKCGKVYDYIIATKDEIWSNKPTILISNIHTIYRRLMRKDTVKLYSNLDYVVFDEAHVYTDYLGGHVYYILQMLKYVARQSNPIFVFSSATIPDPKFIEDLFGQEVKIKQFGKDDKDEKGENRSNEISPSEMKYKRLIIRLYLLPNPLRSIETLYEAIASAVTLWAHKYNQKVITFIDSIAEIATLGDYIKSVILGTRQGREIADHVKREDPNIRDPLNDYSWITIAPSNANDVNFLTGEFKNSIETHHSGLESEKRSEIETAFQEGKIRHLMSTSTLELGIDISDVAIIVQYKLPMKPENVIQRIGRAGRDANSFRIALGIVLLPPSPIGTLYMHNPKLRKRFADIKANRPYVVGYNSDVIKLQALFSSVLFKRALEGKETYITQTRKWNMNNISSAIKEILNELKDNNLDSLISQIGLLDLNELRDKKAQLQKLLENILDRINNYIANNNTRNLDIDEITDKLDSYIKKISNVLWRISEFEKKISGKNVNLSSLKVKFIYYNKDKTQETDPISFLRYTLTDALELLSSLREEIMYAGASSNKLNIENWVKQNEIKINNLKKNLNQISMFKEDSKLLNKIRKLVNEILQKTKSLRLVNMLSLIFSEIIPEEDEEKKDKLLLLQIINFLLGVDNTSNSLDYILNMLKNMDVNAYYIDKSIQRLKNALIKRDRPAFTIFDIINRLSNNKVKFSLMLQPPFPEIEEIEIEKVGLNE